MKDPNPENIDGTVVRKHVFQHSINWGHIALAVVALYVVVQVVEVVDLPESEGDEGNDQEAGLRTEVQLVD